MLIRHSLVLRARDSEDGDKQIIELYLESEPPCVDSMVHEWLRVNSGDEKTFRYTDSLCCLCGMHRHTAIISARDEHILTYWMHRY
jgi:hypothetical protein